MVSMSIHNATNIVARKKVIKGEDRKEGVDDLHIYTIVVRTPQGMVEVAIFTDGDVKLKEVVDHE